MLTLNLILEDKPDVKGRGLGKRKITKLTLPHRTDVLERILVSSMVIISHVLPFCSDNPQYWTRRISFPPWKPAPVLRMLIPRLRTRRWVLARNAFLYLAFSCTVRTVEVCLCPSREKKFSLLLLVSPPRWESGPLSGVCDFTTQTPALLGIPGFHPAT